MDYFEIICRTCFSEGVLKSLFSTGSPKISEILTEIVGIEVIENDIYPQNICTVCLEKLNSAFTFKKQCHNVNKKFKEYLDNLAIKNETEPIKKENDFVVEDDFENNCQSPNNDDMKHIKTENYSKPTKKRSKQTCKICNKSVFHLAKHLRIHRRKKPEEEPIKKENDFVEDDFENNRQSPNNDDIEHKKTENYSKSKKKISKRTCKICNKSVFHLAKHLRIHRGVKPEKSHVCPICERGFTQKCLLTSHIYVHTKEKPFKCSQCDKAYNRRTRLNQHIRITHTPGGNLMSVSERNNIHGVESYECNVCHKKFWKKGILAVHKLCHRGKSYLCSYCGKGFVFMKQLSIHLRVHTGERPYKCTVCEKSFSLESSLRTHKLIHNEEKRFQCLYCEKKSTTRGAHNTHQLIHTDNKPFKCDVCNQNFRHKRTLKVHIITHTGERPYTCKLCEKSFTQSSALRTHQLTHTGEKSHICSVCDKKFAQKGNLTVHMRTHTGETPYVCSICHKGFYDSSSMKKHNRKHDSEK